MSHIKKIFLKVMLGNSDTNIKFHDLVTLLEFLGFERRINGSHNIFRKYGLKTLINIQKDGELAKS